jgi:alkylation response protein AidB-like acyl-CoA dehydrogenase
MEFGLTNTQRDIQKGARKFAEKEFDSKIGRDLDKDGKFPKSIFEKACRLGWVGIEYPEEYGGQSFGLFEKVLVIEEFCRRDSGIGISISLADMASGIILRHGDEQQKKRFLIPLLEEKGINTVAATDSINAVTRAEEDPSGYIVSGKKSFVINGSIANTIVLFCEIHSSSDPGKLTPITLIVEGDREGVKIEGRKTTMGMRMVSVNEIAFDQVKIPRDHRIGGEEDSLTAFLTEQRIKTATQALGIAQGAFERAIEHAKIREQFGRKIIQFQGLQFMLAELCTQVEAARSLVYRAACNYDAKSSDLGPMASMARLFATDVAVRAAVDSIQIHGGIGLMKEYPIERMLRDAKTIQNLEETNLLQRALIGKSMTGL